jgi:hypothetical protein
MCSGRIIAAAIPGRHPILKSLVSYNGFQIGFKSCRKNKIAVLMYKIYGFALLEKSNEICGYRNDPGIKQKQQQYTSLTQNKQSKYWVIRKGSTICSVRKTSKYDNRCEIIISTVLFWRCGMLCFSFYVWLLKQCKAIYFIDYILFYPCKS